MCLRIVSRALVSRQGEGQRQLHWVASRKGNMAVHGAGCVVSSLRGLCRKCACSRRAGSVFSFEDCGLRCMQGYVAGSKVCDVYKTMFQASALRTFVGFVQCSSTFDPKEEMMKHVGTAMSDSCGQLHHLGAVLRLGQLRRLRRVLSMPAPSCTEYHIIDDC